MRAFIKDLAKTYFNEHRRQFGEDAHFAEFLIVEGTTAKKNSYPADLYGYIMYARGKLIRSSVRMRVQYYRCDGDERKRLLISSWFASEAIFYSRIWPLCVDESTGDLVPKFGAHGEYVSEAASMGALIFECDEGVQNWGYMSRLDLEHLALMARRIGQFHGRVLQTRALVSRAAEALPTGVQPAADLAVPTLERCLELLHEDPAFVAQFADGVRRLEELIDGLEDRLSRQPVVNADCLVLCHRNYSQACGYFGYAAATLTQLQIGYWAKVGWASLADDLVILMFADADSSWQLSERSSLVDCYVQGLKSSCAQGWLPTVEDIWREIRLRIPVALYALAVRVDGLSERAIREGRLETAARWNDQFVVDVFKFLIENHFV